MSHKLQKNRIKQHLLLTQADLSSVEEATSLSGASSRSFFCAEAINIGLSDFNETVLDSCRKRRIDIWLPAELKSEVQRVAKAYGVSQQALLRRFILNHATECLRRQGTQQHNPSVVRSEEPVLV